MLKKMVMTLAAVSIATTFIGSAVAASFPSKPIKIIVPFGAGGETDIAARLLATSMQKELGGNRVVVQNVTGASGMIGCKTVLESHADGYTLGFIPSGPLAMHPHMRAIPYTLESFTYVGRAINSPYFLYVDKSSPWNTVPQMIESMKTAPKKYFWGSAGVGSLPYFSTGDVLKGFGAKAKHVSFKDDVNAFQAMAGKRVQLYATTAGVMGKFDIKPIAVMAEERLASLPDVPTVKESGQDISYSQWMVLVAPKDVPKDVLETLSSAMKKATASEEFVEKLAKLSLAPNYLNSADTLEFVRAESAKNKVNIESSMKK